ncbi:hypothetical protein [Micromonospora cabrerizensis]|uniref:hypothetical protein n=1 Tax=Micromonospora TaxID=1873 RepID=UPI001EE8DEBC|nr:hypothetical protein [Micromonospora cabrerizensis]MCG5471396.1 hypothetical protein [Micromonospora cabrerizensis]
MTDLVISAAAEGSSWTEVLGVVGGSVGVLGGLVFGLLSWRLSRRSALASERSADIAAAALTTSQQAVDAADQAAKAADISAREAQRISTIESTRHHDELGPHVDVQFVWRQDRHGGGIFAEVTNNGRYDFWVTGAHLIDGKGATSLAHTGLSAGATLDIYIAELPLEDPGEPTDPWPVIRDAMKRAEIYQVELQEAFHQARDRFGRLELLYRATNEPCQCGRTPADSEGHWATYHAITSVSL